ncbi:MAG: hypothetical protein IKU02_04120 [Bacteroidaceae bacterium]|nr:hypothetical protein [Bacteroidaceae bacterium]
MNYIARLLQLIKAFRAETRTDAITPDSFGAILERMVNLQRQDGYVIYSDHYEIEYAFFREWILASND